MAPKLRIRSTSRSRTAASPTPASGTKKVRATPRPASKSPSRARTPTIEKKARSGTPSKSSTPNRIAARKTEVPRKTTTASRSSSRSRIRPTISTTSSSSASPPPSSSNRQSRSATKTPKTATNEVLKTIEIADEDDEVASTPRRRQRTFRDLTKEPTSRATPLLSTLQTFPVTRSAAAAATKAKKNQSYSIFTNAKTKATAAYKWIVAFVLSVFTFLKNALIAPFVYIRNLWLENKPDNDWMAAAMFIVLCTSFSVIFWFIFPGFVLRSLKYGQKNIAEPAERFQQDAYAKIAQWSGNIHQWSQAKWQALSSSWRTVGTQTK